MDRGAWWATVHGVTNSQTQLDDSQFCNHQHQQAMEHFYHHLKFPCAQAPLHSILCLLILETTGLISVYIVFPFYKLHINGII